VAVSARTTQQGVMATNLLPYHSKLLPHRDLIVAVLAAHHALPAEQLKLSWPFRTPQVLRAALIKALRKNNLIEPREALAIASIIDVSLYDR
jgi:hypothetical protein